MVTDEILYRILQASSALACVTLLINCMSMHNVRPWLPYPLYLLSFMCLITFLSTFFMRAFMWPVIVATLAVFALACVSAALHRYLEPIPKNGRESLNRRLLSRTLPLVGVFLLIWCVGVAFDGGAAYFVRIEQQLNRVLNNQQRILAHQDSTDERISKTESADISRDALTKSYRDKLDTRLNGIELNQSGTSLRLHRLETDRQKR